MDDRPLILIPAHTEAIGEGLFNALRVTYADTVLAHGGIPVIAPVTEDCEALEEMLDRAGGLLLPGGSDVAPELYGETRHERLGRVEPKLDRMEVGLIRGAYHRGRPVLAICRGMQSLAVALGGTLYQDLPSQCPSELSHELRAFGRSHVAHTLILEPNSLLARVLGVTEIGVNSLHHQGIRRLPGQLTITGRADDGQIEAVEDPRRTFVVGLQCHPEELWRAEPRFSALFTRFIEAAAAHQA
ncbi:MAG TPA: gamma-glutamyl-gamma-aminobutyrate hydrolase family protein [Chloroflexota bacterium]|nr:gamma-glutamyl-gamma-aminobutyrate hydrolase family protein [Chloroflexota bacterium]